MNGSLPDPVITDQLALCPKCGYSLAGLVRPAPCPECGQHLPARLLVLHGVPKGLPGVSKPLKAGFILLFFVVWLGPQALIFFVAPRWGGPAALLLLLAGVVGVLVFVFTRGSRRSGAVRCLVWPQGLVLEPLAQNPEESQGRMTLEWQGNEGCRLKRVGPFWRQIAITRRGTPAPLLEMGFRCPDASAPVVEEGLAAAFNKPADAPPHAAPAGDHPSAQPDPPAYTPPQ